MRIDYPQRHQLDALRQLWQEAFGDEDAFLDIFFCQVYSSDRCRCVTVGDQVVGALYWLDCRCEGRPMAYLYAVATARDYQGQGLCRALMADTHALLRELGYAGCILVPGDSGLFAMYAGMGYEVATQITEVECTAGKERMPLQSITGEEYMARRKALLPPGGVVQEGENLTFLSALTQFYAGEDCMLCVNLDDGNLFAPEFWGNPGDAPSILATLGCAAGVFRMAGCGQDFSMYHPLSDAPKPTYFAFAFD